MIYEKFFRRKETDNKEFEKLLHTKKWSNDNIHNRIHKFTDNGLFLWYSSNTKTNQIGSLMVYRVQNDAVETWYATIENKDGWTISKTKGIDLSELRAYLD